MQAFQQCQSTYANIFQTGYAHQTKRRERIPLFQRKIGDESQNYPENENATSK